MLVDVDVGGIASAELESMSKEVGISKMITFRDDLSPNDVRWSVDDMERSASGQPARRWNIPGTQYQVELTARKRLVMVMIADGGGGGAFL